MNNNEYRLETLTYALQLLKNKKNQTKSTSYDELINNLEKERTQLLETITDIDTLIKG